MYTTTTREMAPMLLGANVVAGQTSDDRLQAIRIRDQLHP